MSYSHAGADRTLKLKRRISHGKGKCRFGNHSIPTGLRYFEVAEIHDGRFWWSTMCQRAMQGDSCVKDDDPDHDEMVAYERTREGTHPEMLQ